MNWCGGTSRCQSSNPSLAWQLGACAQSSPSPAARHSISIRSFGRPTPSPVQEQRVTRRQEDRPASMRRAGPEIITQAEPGAESDQEIQSYHLLVPGTPEICRVAKIALVESEKRGRGKRCD